MGMTIDDLKQECKYCYREVDASGLEGFRCTNKTVNMETSWCRPKNANEPCSKCEYCKPREEMGMTIDETVKELKHIKALKGVLNEENIEAIETATDTMRKYQKFQDQALSLYMEKLKDDMVGMLEELDLQIDELTDYNLDYNSEVAKVHRLIRDKINTLKENTIE